ncbi:uncharacterized protein LOC105889593 isoform X2 [Clupea harengus]|uniref:Zona pellucida sperm-binding protein 3 n=1 Tax=Clupea harengus TaxID=7950 RepID=A0A6P8GHM9_CLUHA|nr:uncharacterized protein LOC105889593 isoform X2 [Clupea harengus]
MGSGWQVKFFQTLLCACSVSVSFHLSVKRESWRERVHQRAEHPIEHMDQNPAAQAPPEKDPMFEWISQLVQSRRDFREKPLVAKTRKMPETLQMDDPIVHREGVQVPQRPLMIDLPKDGSRNQPGRSSQDPRHPMTTATQTPLSYEVNASQRQLNDRLVQIPVKQELQRPLMMNLPMGVTFGGSGKPPGWSSQDPLHPTTTATQRQRPYEVNASQRQLNDRLVQIPVKQELQRPLMMNLPMGVTFGGSGKLPGWSSQDPIHPTTTATQRQRPYEVNASQRQLNDRLVQIPVKQELQRPLMMDLPIGVTFGGSGKPPGWSSQDPIHPTTTATQRQRPYEVNASQRQLNDRLVQIPVKQELQRPLLMDLPMGVTFGGSGKPPGWSSQDPLHPTTTATQRQRPYEVNASQRQLNDRLVQIPVKQELQRPLMMNLPMGVTFGGSGKPPGWSSQDPIHPTTTATQRQRPYEVNASQRQLNDRLVQIPVKQELQRPLLMDLPMGVTFGGSGKPPGWSSQDPRHPTTTATQRQRPYEVNASQRQLNDRLVQIPVKQELQRPLLMDLPMGVTFGGSGKPPGWSSQDPLHPTTTATQRQRPYEVNASQRQLNDRLVQIPVKQELQRPLMMDLPMGVTFGGSGKPPGWSSQDPLHPTTTATQRQRPYEVNASQRQLNDRLVQIPVKQELQRPLMMNLPMGVTFGGSGKPPGWSSQDPIHPTTTATQRQRPYEVNASQRQLNDRLVQIPVKQELQRPLMMNLPKDVMFAGSRNQPGQSSQDPQHSMTTATQRPLSYEVNASQRQLNDRLVQIPVKQELQRPLMMNLPKDVMFAGSRNQPGQSPQDPRHPTTTATQRPRPYEVNASQRQLNDRLVQIPVKQELQRPLMMNLPMGVTFGGSGKPPGWSSQDPRHPTTTATQRPRPYEVNASQRQLNDRLVQIPVKQEFQRPLMMNLPMGVTFGGSGKPPGWSSQDPRHPTTTATQRPRPYEVNVSQRQLNDRLVQIPVKQELQRPLMMNLPKDVMFAGSRNQPGQSSQDPQHSMTTATQRPLSYEVNASQRQLNDRLVQIPVKQELQRPLMMNLPMGVTFAGSRNQPGQSYEGPQHSQKPQPSETSASRKHSSQTWQPSPAQSSQRPQLTAVETLPKDQKTELRQPETPQSVTAVCGEELLQLTVKMDFLGTGHLINPADITLGGCAPTRLDESQQELLFETALHECGGTAQMFEDEVVYTFSLIYTARPVGDSPIVKTNDATVRIDCYYDRFYNVSSNALRPTWTPYQSSQLSDGSLDFSLRLMTDDWQYERLSTKFFLGNMIKIEASVRVENHVPLRVYVDSCVAAVQPEIQSGTSYVLIEKHGCLSDSKLMASRSQFMPRKQDEKLQMEIEAFKFADESSDSFYIICNLRAVSAAGAAVSGHKACHYSMENDRWNNADGNNEVCSCCNAETCPIRMTRAAEDVKGRLVKLGPISVKEKTI